MQDLRDRKRALEENYPTSQRHNINAGEVVTKRPRIDPTSANEVRVYSYSVMPEKARFIWVVCFSKTKLDIRSCRLQLWKIRQAPGNLGVTVACQEPTGMNDCVYNHEPMSDLSWEVVGECEGHVWYQYKLCFPAMQSTHAREIFTARLFGQAAAGGIAVDIILGPLSVVSTTTQRTAEFYAKMAKHFPDPLRSALFHNFSTHPPSKRHFKNGKGTNQGTRRSGGFIPEQLCKAVTLQGDCSNLWCQY